MKSNFAKINEDIKKLMPIKKIGDFRRKTEEKEIEQTFPEYCRHENIGKKSVEKDNLPKNKCFTGLNFRIYDTRRRKIIL